MFDEKKKEWAATYAFILWSTDVWKDWALPLKRHTLLIFLVNTAYNVRQIQISWIKKMFKFFTVYDIIVQNSRFFDSLLENKWSSYFC